MTTVQLKKTKRPVINYQKRKRQKYLTVLWVLGVVFLAAALIWALQGTLSNSVSTTTTLVYQKVMHTLHPVVNELATAAYVQMTTSNSGEFDPSSTIGVFDNVTLGAEVKDIVKKEDTTKVLAANTTTDGQEKWIEVDLSDQRLYAHEGGATIYNFLVSTGKRWTPTPIGEYRVWIKLRYANMVGGSKKLGDYYNLPNVPYVMYFNQGYGIHGTYWHNNFGRTMSHGCVNVKTEEMAKLYDWAGPVIPSGKSMVKSTPENPGIRIVIHS